MNNHYYCNTCLSLLELRAYKLTCNICHTTSNVVDVKKEGYFLSMMDMKAQLRLVIARTKTVLLESLTNLRNRHDASDPSISGIRTGAVCRELLHKGVLKWSDLTLTVNTDGSSVFES